MRKKPSQPQIPNIALLYGGSKYSQPRPAVQAGFIYKARPEPYKHYSPIQPQMQPSYNSYSYQPPFQVVRPKAVDKNIFTPFLDTNKLPGEFVPIFKTKNLPYKVYEEIR